MLDYKGLDKQKNIWHNKYKNEDFAKMENDIGKVYYCFKHYYNIERQIEFDVVNEDTNTQIGTLVVSVR